MARGDPVGASPDGALPGLEGHLRNLILTNATPGNGHPGESHAPAPESSSPLSPTQPAHQNARGDVATDMPGNQSPQSSKTGRKRLNQAQRRQMSSQLSIPVDTRPPPAASHSAKPHFGQGTHDPRRPHYGHAGPHSQGLDNARSANSSHSQGQWGGRPHSYSANPRYPPSSPHNQRDHRLSSHDGPAPHFGRGNRTLFDHRRQQIGPEEIDAQATLLDGLCWHVVMNSEIDRTEIAEKENLRQQIESICRAAITRYEEEQAARHGFPAQSVELKCFGSLSSGFATKASDMDLGLLSPLSMIQPDVPGSPVPRLLERALLDAGLGARLLARTRVPIIKLCQYPPEKLRQDLLAERDRWEKGLHDEGQEDDDNEHGGIAHGQHNEDHADSATPNLASPSATEFEVPWGDNGGTQRFYLKQGPSLSLTAYYGLAKRILRKAGGRDVTISNQHEFTGRDWAVLTRVCQAFVDGLSDADLQKRLAQYPSLSFQPVYDMPNHRSLLGVFTQVEGEQILQVWDAWPLRDTFKVYQSQFDQAVRSWQLVQGASSFGVDPLTYTKELQIVLDKLRRVPAMQLVSLEQSQHETPRQYHTRAKIILNLFYSSQDGLPHNIQDAITDRYISGIYQNEIRETVKTSMSVFSESSELEAAACLHKCFHLARELERAIEKKLYETAQIDDIREYIKLLRSPIHKVMKGNISYSFVVPVAPQSSALLARIREIQDPHGMAPNRPRDRYQDHLEFPKLGAGVQCDINFSAHLALQNTLLLRCYSHTDSRVRPMVLFIKHWAKVRGINSGYRGTLSSYGYVLMVLHYLVNVAQPFVCPNLQQLAPPPPPNLSQAEVENTIACKGYNIQFWRNEQDIMQFAHANQLNHNTESVGHLLRGFFEYFAQNGMMSNGSGRGFDWGRDVLSLRTQGGLQSKQDKGWTGAKTVFQAQGAGPSPNTQAEPLTAHQQNGQTHKAGESATQSKTAQTPSKEGEVKEVRHRYLFAIEDPFELDHNVARTVTHNGIVSIRDEFRRAWRIIRTSGNGPSQENLLQDLNELDESSKPFLQLLEDIHGPQA